MPPWNMTFTLFLLDPRPIDEWLPALDDGFGGRFIQDLEFKAEGSLRYTNYVFGLTIDCFGDATWKEGRVYRFVGSSDGAFLAAAAGRSAATWSSSLSAAAVTQYLLQGFGL